jgi:class 3 adenylate cyclase
VRRRFREACAAFGTETAEEDGLLVARWPQAFPPSFAPRSSLSGGEGVSEASAYGVNPASSGLWVTGTVHKFIGDAVVDVVGVPHVHEDDAERAVRSAFAMHEATMA